MYGSFQNALFFGFFCVKYWLFVIHNTHQLKWEVKSIRNVTLVEFDRKVFSKSMVGLSSCLCDILLPYSIINHIKEQMMYVQCATTEQTPNYS